MRAKIVDYGDTYTEIGNKWGQQLGITESRWDQLVDGDEGTVTGELFKDDDIILCVRNGARLAVISVLGLEFEDTEVISRNNIDDVANGIYSDIVELIYEKAAEIDPLIKKHVMDSVLCSLMEDGDRTDWESFQKYH